MHATTPKMPAARRTASRYDVTRVSHPPAQALLGAAVAIAGVLAAANRTSAVIKVLAEAVPQLSAVLPTVITACGAIIAALSQPPDLPGNRTK